MVSYKRIASHYSKGRKFKNKTYSIDRITIHCVVGLWTAKQIADYFATTSRTSSPNYGCGSDGKISLCVEEKDRSYCSSSGANDARAITIECASKTSHPYAFPVATYNALLDLCTDICRRNGKNRLIWIPDKNTALNYTPHGGEMILTVHRWFANKACPGDWMMQRMSSFATEVTNRLKQKPAEEIDMTKDEVIKLIKDTVNETLEGKSTTPSDWALEENVIEEGEQKGITDGTRPQGYAKREEVVAMILRAIK